MLEQEEQKKSKGNKKLIIILLLLLLFGIFASYFFFIKDKRVGYDGSEDIEEVLNSSTENNEPKDIANATINEQPADSEAMNDINISTMTFEKSKENDERKEGYAGSEDIEGGLNSSTENNEPKNIINATINGQPDDSEAIDDINDFTNIFKKGKGEILFNFDSYNVKEKYKDLLQKFANSYLKNNKQSKIIIEGYTCDIGTKNYNDTLSYKRTNAVYKLLLKYGIPKKNIELKWHGERKCYKLGYEKKKGYRRVNVSIMS